MQIVINIPKQTYNFIMNRLYMPVDEDLIVEAVRNGTPLEQEPFDEIIDKTVKEIYVQCKQTNSNFSKDWNEGFNDGMFHTITIIKGIRKGKIQ